MRDLPNKPHDWTRFEVLWRDVCRAYDRLEGPYAPPAAHEIAGRDLDLVREARAAFESPGAMIVRMVRHGHSVEALSPNRFVDLWRQGYR